MSGAGRARLERVEVQTRNGTVAGCCENGVARFLGIPYALPPIGALRWRPPQPLDPWSGVFDAAQFGPSCAQPEPDSTTFVSSDRALRRSEDCLYLNVWSPSPTPRDPAPVMVWLHGGGFLNGSGAERWYDGASFARRGIVIVTCNYRLGALGYLAHAELDAESPETGSNKYGLLDQIAVLEWVRDNIAAFGGDPQRVTVFGQSAGAASVRSLLEAPRARGLFHRAIQQSGGFVSSALAGSGAFRAAYEDKLRIGREFQRLLKASTLAELRARPVEEVVAASVGSIRRSYPQMRWWPVADGRFLPRGVTDDVASGTADVPVMLGWTRNEANVLLPGFRARPMMYFGMGTAVLRGAAWPMFRRHPPYTPDGIWAGLEELFTQLVFVEPAFEMATQIAAIGRRVYAYQFDRVAPRNADPRRRASHTQELPYVFGTLDDDGGYEPADDALAERMMRHWIAFASDGDPGGDWPCFAGTDGPVMHFDAPCEVRGRPQGPVFAALRRRRARKRVSVAR